MSDDKSKSRREGTGIMVEVERLLDSEDGKSAAMFLNQHIADGELGGRKFHVGSIIPEGSLLFEFAKEEGDASILGRDRYVISMRSVLDAIVAHIEARDEEETDG